MLLIKVKFDKPLLFTYWLIQFSFKININIPIKPK